MSDVNVTYNYKIPNEQFIDDFSENLVGTFTYSGPEVLVVTVPEGGSAYTQKLDGPVYDNEFQVEINVTETPELLPLADLLYGTPYDHVATFDEEVLENGAIYMVQNNKRIEDYYWPPVYDVENSQWPSELQLRVADTLSPNMRTAIAKGEMFIEILEKFELDTADAEKLEEYKTALTEYSNMCAMPWKYSGQNPFDLLAPKIPMSLVSALNGIKAAGLDT